MVQDAHAALMDDRSRNAEQAFSRALALLETCSPKVMVLLATEQWFFHVGQVVIRSSEVNAARLHSSCPHAT